MSFQLNPIRGQGNEIRETLAGNTKTEQRQGSKTGNGEELGRPTQAGDILLPVLSPAGREQEARGRTPTR